MWEPLRRQLVKTVLCRASGLVRPIEGVNFVFSS
jgi:hypothetical protein